MPSRTGRRSYHKSLRHRLARAVERPPWWIFPLQGGAVLAAVSYLLAPFYLAGSEIAYEGTARVVECHRRPWELWLYYKCRLAPPGDHGSALEFYSDPATSMHPLHGIAEFELHGFHTRGKGNLTMIVAKGTPRLPSWFAVLYLPGFFAVTYLIATIEERSVDRLAEALRRSDHRSRRQADSGKITD